MLKVCELEDRRQNSVDLQQCGLNGGCYDSRRKNELALERERERERESSAGKGSGPQGKSRILRTPRHTFFSSAVVGARWCNGLPLATVTLTAHPNVGNTPSF